MRVVVIFFILLGAAWFGGRAILHVSEHTPQVVQVPPQPAPPAPHHNKAKPRTKPAPTDPKPDDDSKAALDDWWKSGGVADLWKSVPDGCTLSLDTGLTVCPDHPKMPSRNQI